jgi:hypothetical protein
MRRSTFHNSSARSEGKFDFALPTVASKLYGNDYNRPMTCLVETKDCFQLYLTASQFREYSLSGGVRCFYCPSRRWVDFSGDDICFRNLIFLRCCSKL